MGGGWSKLNQGRLMIGNRHAPFIMMCIILYRRIQNRIRIITKDNLLKRYVSKYIYALQRYNIISLRMNITYPHNIHCNCRAVDILFVILLSACFGEVADVATWRYCINVKRQKFQSKARYHNMKQLDIVEWVKGHVCTYP